MRILLLEDDEFIANEVKNYFELDGHDVETFTNGESLVNTCNLEIYDIFLLDINTPKMNGLEVLKYIRDSNISTPAIFTTAMSDIEYIKEAYEIGCNDYVRKPFIFEELELRIKQLIYKECDEKLKISDNYSFDLCKMKLLYKDEVVLLNKQEENLLYILCKNFGNVISSNIIIDYVWDDRDICTNTLRTTIKKLRKKLNENFIKNIRNIGYKIEND